MTKLSTCFIYIIFVVCLLGLNACQSQIDDDEPAINLLCFPPKVEFLLQDVISKMNVDSVAFIIHTNNVGLSKLIIDEKFYVFHSLVDSVNAHYWYHYEVENVYIPIIHWADIYLRCSDGEPVFTRLGGGTLIIFDIHDRIHEVVTMQ